MVNVNPVSSPRNILIIFYEEKMFIGDSYILINKLSACQSYFPDAAIDINCCNKKYTGLCAALLKHNPFISNFNNMEWHELDYSAYDIVFCILPDEQKLLQVLQDKYTDAAYWPTTIYSLTAQFINTHLNPNIISAFPPFTAMLNNQDLVTQEHAMELYISPEERDWAYNWLREHGLKEHERLFIILDNTSDREKLMTMDTYYGVLSYLLNQDAVKVLIYDETGVGKESFYRTWIGEDKLSKMIFANKLGLRQDICLLGAEQTRLILGPCTGLMHCASGIYNYFVRTGRPVASLPSIITYTGKYIDADDTPDHWWGNAPLVTCLIVRQDENDGKEVVVLHQLSEDEKKDATRLLPCKYFSADMLIRFLPAIRNELLI
ncbi:hypothetical protein [Chitinophaga sp.]|uniref:glycosyltransferase family 9 protein n=1 Tax=Chitinophaga sp. TaxID=1869181 RepID=UPI0031D9CEC4